MSLDHPRTAVITGAGSGIGRALALALTSRGYRVGIADIDEEAAARTLEMVREAGGAGETWVCDVGDIEQVTAMADHFFEEWGKVGLLVNNAGIGGGGYIGETSMEDWRAVVNTNLWGVVHGCHAFLPRMKEQGSGHIVNTASIAGQVPVIGFAPYNTTKAAIISFSETLLMEAAPFNIGVTVLCPSMVPTNILENSFKCVKVDSYEEGEWGVELITTGIGASRITVDGVAKLLLDGIERDRLFVNTNVLSRLNWINSRISPEWYFRGIAYLNKKGLAKGFLLWAAKKGLA